MGTKAAALAALLQGRRVYYVNIEEPDGQDSTVETAIEDDPQGVSFSVEGQTITFKGGGKAASFIVLENAQIFATLSGEEEGITTFAGNGGLQIKQRAMG
jgi:cobalamin biosynthesis protein CbiD